MTLEAVKDGLRMWNSFALFYVALPVLLLTLNPFDFQPFTASEFWVWRFSVEDFSRNVLLLFPFGLMLRHNYQRRHSFALLAGLLLSGCVEIGQLFIAERTSNLVDLISNSGGALLGSLVYQGIFEGVSASVTLPFLFMLMPVCWAIAIVSSFHPEFVCAFMPAMIAALSLFRYIPLSPLKKQLARIVWIVAAILPLVNADLVIGCLVLASVPLILFAVAKVDLAGLRVGVASLLCASTSIVLLLVYRWYISIENWVWIPFRHFSWMMILLSLLATGSGLVWYSVTQDEAEQS